MFVGGRVAFRCARTKCRARDAARVAKRGLSRFRMSGSGQILPGFARRARPAVAIRQRVRRRAADRRTGRQGVVERRAPDRAAGGYGVSGTRARLAITLARRLRSPGARRIVPHRNAVTAPAPLGPYLPTALRTASLIA